MTKATKEDLYKQVINKIDELEPELIEVCKFIHQNPELGLQEYKASGLLCDVLKKNGFKIKKGLAGMETSFVATIGHSKDKPAIAFVCEYDALPDIGHGCGHNIIATSSLGAALGLKEVFSKLKCGKISVIGTPAEETTNGKLPMIKAGIFDNLDAAMMIHPSNHNYVTRKALGLVQVDIEFFGKPAHAAASPDQGVNALDALILFFNGIALLRQQVPDDVRIHGIITDGGKARNIIPEYTRAEFLVRSVSQRTLFALLEKVKACADGAALSTGCTVKVEIYKDKILYDMNSDDKLAKLFYKHLENLGVKGEFNKETTHLGSTDMGNVSQVAPSIHPYLSITDKDVPSHSSYFTKAAISEKGLKTMITGAKALALTGLDVLVG